MKHLYIQIWIHVILLNVAVAWFFDTPDIHGQRRKGLSDSQQRGSAEGLLDSNEGNVDMRLNKRNRDYFLQNSDNLNEALAIIIRFDENKDGVLNLKELYNAVSDKEGPALKRILGKL